MTGRKNRAVQVPPVVPYKALENFMGQREVLAVHDFSVLLCLRNKMAGRFASVSEDELCEKCIIKKLSNSVFA